MGLGEWFQNAMQQNPGGTLALGAGATLGLAYALPRLIEALNPLTGTGGAAQKGLGVALMLGIVTAGIGYMRDGEFSFDFLQDIGDQISDIDFDIG